MADASAARDRQAEVDRLLDGLVAELGPAAAARALAQAANRAAVKLHNLARGGSAARRETAEWPAWAGLQNAARNLVLTTSTARDLAGKLPDEPSA